MSTSAATVEKPVPTGDKEPPNRLRHIFCRCDRGMPVRVSFCGIKSGPQVGNPYDPNGPGDPDLCTVCIDLQKQGCQRCK